MNCNCSIPAVFPFLACVAIAALLVGVFYLPYLRRKALSELAASMGLLFTKNGPESYYLEQTRLGIFNMGRARNASNLIEIRGSGPDMSFFDYRYTTGGGKNSHTHNFTLALFDLKTPKAPTFELKPENFIYKIGELIGFKDIDIQSSQLFSDKYRLTGPNEIEILSFFSPGTVAYFEQHLGWQAQGAGRYLLVFKGEKLIKPAYYQSFMEEAKNMVASIVRP
ncbi:MAG: hypothetical protein A2X34_03690 [Elusimicrobia bacterium GWC2_51_8]|nr:MAG: hypothetical protein A2X33_11030 [Elusimicrobia bacterium GWA2_51_34]OGR60364.1 MAG: hypothetical protein A2X34_03690 [Elusimicrobia bacterium GWC2_51_8]HAF95127.1 hypothetical protein [Elusimicrobiota bacterium]HCE97202.1 hypothetical protein [Elusimicrobiota bacterium]